MQQSFSTFVSLEIRFHPMSVYSSVRLIGLVFVISILSCSTPLSDNSAISKRDTIPEYIIHKPDFSSHLDSISGDTILIIVNYYHDINIILIDSLPQIYYHRKRFVCGGCMGEQKHPILPQFIGLNPERLIRIDSSKKILKEILKDEEAPKWVYLISNRDTITDSRYFELKEALINQGVNISTRLLTEEETNVLQCVLDKRGYNSSDFSWNETDFRFVETIEIEGVDSLKIQKP